MSNVLVDIAKEDPNAYCINGSTIQTAIDRGISKEYICIAIVDILAENTGSFYLEDESCCAFVAMRYKRH